MSPIDYQLYEGRLALTQQTVIRDLAIEILGGVNEEELKHRLDHQQDLLLLLALDNEKPIGFKLGYQRSRTKFHSWIGGVLPGYRGQGCATKLMQMQTEWCKHRGYKTIQTQTLNQWKAMLILNLKNGFDIIGVFTDTHLGLKIMLEKSL